MARIVKRLTPEGIRALKHDGRPRPMRFPDGENLYIQLSETGGRQWLLRYGRRHTLQPFRKGAGAWGAEENRRRLYASFALKIRKAAQYQKPDVLRSKVWSLFSKIGMSADHLGCMAHSNAQILSGAEILLADPGNCLSQIRQSLRR